jgi:glyoxylase-like metal-dependent hydrolase (beta-lactamase superfamily II)
MIPAEGIAWFDGRGTPESILLTNRHHDRDSWRLREAFGCEVHCIRNGLHELDGRGPVVPFDFGDELPGGVVAHEIGGISPDETALYVPSHRAVACADGVVRLSDGADLEFVPDNLMDEPEETKRRLRAAYQHLLDDSGVEFDYLLLAHGEPITSGAEDALRAFIAAA